MTRATVVAMSKTTTRKTPEGFVDGSARIDRLLSDTERAERVAKIRADGREMDRTHALNLAMIRKAAELTQEEVAERLGARQGDISRIENRSDLLLSTLLNYLTATGADDARIVVTVHGQEFDLDLASLGRKKTDPTPPNT
ncbi:MAG TPA: helix-turn-helix transcriptional regulator [Jatrophihabitantaceae bacterium]